MATLQIADYSHSRDFMGPGDIIAFGGKGGFSDVIKFMTRGAVSHVGIILQSALLLEDEPQRGKFNQIIESTSLNGFSGVAITRLSDRIHTYNGDIWWLPLSTETRDRMNFPLMYDFLLHQEHKPYDMSQAVKSALDALDGLGLTWNREDFTKFFCSELVAAALEVSGAIGRINASEVTPMELCRWAIYAGVMYQLKGEPKEIEGFNSRRPALLT